MNEEPISKLMFESLSPYAKGYVVYMCGCLDSEPNIPKKYKASEVDLSEYKRGEMKAIIEIIDVEG